MNSLKFTGKDTKTKGDTKAKGDNRKINNIIDLLNYLQCKQEPYDFFGVDFMSKYLALKGFKMLISSINKEFDICSAILYRISPSYMYSFNKKILNEQFITYLRDTLECKIYDLLRDDDIISAVCCIFNVNITVFELLSNKSRIIVKIYSYTDGLEGSPDNKNDDNIAISTVDYYENKSMLYFAKTHNQYYALVQISGNSLEDHLWTS